MKNSAVEHQNIKILMKFSGTITRIDWLFYHGEEVPTVMSCGGDRALYLMYLPLIPSNIIVKMPVFVHDI